jgi:hypothetical protein
LLVLALVLVAGAVLAQVASRTVVGALESRGALEELQRRWAATSCQATLLARAEKLLDDAERGGASPNQSSRKYLRKPMRELRTTIQLAGMDYDLVLTDEQAKLNVNTLMAEADRASAQVAVARLVAQHDPTAAIDLQAIASPEAGATSQPLPRIGAYAQVFGTASPERLLGSTESPGLAAEVTCWGDGKVNVRRAGAAAIREACDRIVPAGKVQELLAVRDRNPYARLPDMLVVLDKVDAGQRAKIAERLTDRSTCHGLWVIARNSQRSWCSLAVGAGGPEVAPPATAGQAPALLQRYEFWW